MQQFLFALLVRIQLGPNGEDNFLQATCQKLVSQLAEVVIPANLVAQDRRLSSVCRVHQFDVL